MRQESRDGDSVPTDDKDLLVDGLDSDLTTSGECPPPSQGIAKAALRQRAAATQMVIKLTVSSIPPGCVDKCLSGELIKRNRLAAGDAHPET